jgi:hypothetical protein
MKCRGYLPPHSFTVSPQVLLMGCLSSLSVVGRKCFQAVLGRCLKQVQMVVVYTLRDEAIRVISARKATRQEQRQYEEG